MALFHYQGLDQRGEMVAGDLEAATEEAVASYLSEKNIIPIEITAPASNANPLSSSALSFFQQKVKLIDLIFFCRQMYTMLHAGVPMLATLRGLRETTTNPALEQVLRDINEDLAAGVELSVALKRHPAVFSSLFISTIEVGEASGRLAESFLELAGYLERERETIAKIRSAMHYPMIVVIAIGLALLILNMFVIPAFAKVFTQFHAELPLPTRIILGFSNFTVSYWYIILLALGGGVWSVRNYLKTAEGKRRWDEIKLKLPVVGEIIRLATLSRFIRALATALHAGVAWTQGLSVAAHAIDNEYLAEKVIAMRENVERGDTIAQAAINSGLFTPLIVQMIRVGEQTGDLDRLLTEVAEYHEREIDYQLKNLSANIEPILITVIGIVVLILALGIFLPMWSMGQVAIKH
jgi:MSHA biogenesis protein MshG